MKIPSPIQILLKAILIPLLAVISLNRFNFFSYVTFVPDDYKFDVGLTVYLALIEAVYEIAKRHIAKSRSEIECVFYERKDSVNIKNTPVFVCDSQLGVTTILCRIRLRGNVDNLRKCSLVLNLPTWLSSQVSTDHISLEYSDNKLMWKFDRFLSDSTSLDDKYAEMDIKIPVILTTDTEGLSTIIQPKLVFSTRFLKRALLRTNCVQIRNEE